MNHGVIAVLRDGSEVELSPELGATPAEVVAKLTSNSLTGSAVALDDAWLETADGGLVRYGDVRELRPPWP